MRRRPPMPPRLKAKLFCFLLACILITLAIVGAGHLRSILGSLAVTRVSNMVNRLDRDGHVYTQQNLVGGLVDAGVGKLVFEAGGAAAGGLHAHRQAGSAARQKGGTAQGPQGDLELNVRHLPQPGQDVLGNGGLEAVEFRHVAHQGGYAKSD